MAYEFQESIKERVEESTLYVSDRVYNELDEVYRKAKAMDEIEQAYWKSNTPENFAYEFVGIFEKHFSNDMESADDER
ncbi:hypothetical protein [Staphylococcus xylosus]|uniref:hypothetical protein n=1 Tax=Staphylococcus xylosus TaxID=1288 RepID=UPI001C3ECB61|nr:hypothetical protein [Staphylococcus xylosus]